MPDQATPYDTVLKMWNHFYAGSIDLYEMRDELGSWLRNERSGVKQNKQSLLTPRRAYNAYHLGQFHQKAKLYTSLAFDYPCFKAGHEWGNWGVQIPMPNFPEKSRLVDKPTDLLPEYYHSLQSWVKECEEKIKPSIPRPSPQEIWNDISLEQLILPFGFGFYIGDYSLKAAKYLYFLVDQGLHLREFKWGDEEMSISFAGKLIEFILDRQETFNSISTVVEASLGFIPRSGRNEESNVVENSTEFRLRDMSEDSHRYDELFTHLRSMYGKSQSILKNDWLYGSCYPWGRMNDVEAILQFRKRSVGETISTEGLRMNLGDFLSHLPSHRTSVEECFYRKGKMYLL